MSTWLEGHEDHLERIGHEQLPNGENHRIYLRVLPHVPRLPPDHSSREELLPLGVIEGDYQAFVGVTSHKVYAMAMDWDSDLTEIGDIGKVGPDTIIPLETKLNV